MPRAVTISAPRIGFFSMPDGYRCAVRVWETDHPVGRLVFVHGLISHGGWYLSTCRYLAQAGFEVHFLERRGSGLNPVRRGDVDDWVTWLADVERYLESLAKDLPVILLGMSWGGKFVAAVARRRPELLRAAGMFCPGLFARQMPGWTKRIGLRLGRTVGLGNLSVTVPLQDPALFTQAPRWQEYIAHDPFTLRKITIRFAAEDLKLTRFATAAPGEIKVPMLLMLAGHDRIVENSRVLDFFHRLGSSQKRLIEYPAASHTLEFEPDPTVYMEDLRRWCADVTR
jgi:acylglycerol lipase